MSPMAAGPTTHPSPPNPWMVHTAVIENIDREIDLVATYQLKFTDPQLAAQYRFRPGQFNMLYMPGCGESAISHSGPADGDGQSMLHTIRFVGRVTEAISRLQVGDQIGVRGPYGSAWPLDECRGQDVIILSGGLGLAPLRPVIYHLIAHRGDFARVVLLHGARTPDLILYSKEFDNWRQAGIELQTTVDRADRHWQGSVGVVPGLLERLRNVRAATTRVLICGPEVMMHFSAQSVLALGIPECAIWLSLERNMQCAVGLCGHCQLGPVFICKDGPVFPYASVRNLLRTRDF